MDETTRWSLGAGLAAISSMILWAFTIERRLGKMGNGAITAQKERVDRVEEVQDGHTRALSKDRAGIAGLEATVAANTKTMERMETALDNQDGTLKLILEHVTKTD